MRFRKLHSLPGIRQLLSWARFIPRGNKKRRTGLVFIRSNQTFYFTFFVSIVVHAGLIYSIPAVDLFSEGGESQASELLVVDFYPDAAAADTLEDIAFAEANQFRANPVETSDPATQPPDEAPEDIDAQDSEMALPTLEDFAPVPEDDYTLLSHTQLEQPEIEQKRQTRKLPNTENQRIPQRPTPKLHPEKARITPLKKQAPRNVHESLKIESLPHLPSSLKREAPEPSLKFALRQPATPERQQQTSLPVTQEQLLPGKRRSDVQKPEDPVQFRSDRGAGASNVQKRRFGMARESENDANRFGIFAGRSFQEPQIKETIQRVEIQTEQKEATTDDIATAKALDTQSAQIEGPIKGRRIIRQPKPPQVDIDIDVELKFKFWVLSDGTIGDVIPLKRGNATLERIAIAYLKQWQFQPLPAGASQQKIWGTIPIRFSVR